MVTQVEASSRKLNLRADLRWVTKWSRKFTRNFSQVVKNAI